MLALVRPQGWPISAVIFVLTAANIVTAELQSAAQHEQLSSIATTTAEWQSQLEAATQERFVDALITGMVDESQVFIVRKPD